MEEGEKSNESRAKENDPKSFRRERRRLRRPPPERTRDYDELHKTRRGKRSRGYFSCKTGKSL